MRGGDCFTLPLFRQRAAIHRYERRTSPGHGLLLSPRSLRARRWWRGPHLATNSASAGLRTALSHPAHETSDGEEFFNSLGQLSKDSLVPEVASALRESNIAARLSFFSARERRLAATRSLSILSVCLKLGAILLAGVAYASQRGVRVDEVLALSNLLLGISAALFPAKERSSRRKRLPARRTWLGKPQRFLSRPLKIVRG